MTPEYENSKKTICLAGLCCDGPPDPVMMRRFFKQALLAHWEDPLNHGRYTDVLGCFTPTKEDGSGNLDITMAFQDNSGAFLVTSSQLNISMTPMKIKKLVFGNEMAVDSTGAITETGWQVDTQLTITHTFSDADVALAAAQSTLEFLAGFSDMFRNVLGLNSFDPQAVTQPALCAGTKYPQHYFHVDVVFDMNYNFCISVNLESHRLKVISNELTPLI